MVIHLRYVLQLLKTAFLFVSLICLFTLKTFGSDYTDFAMVITDQDPQMLSTILKNYGEKKEIALIHKITETLDKLDSDTQSVTSESKSYSSSECEHGDETDAPCRDLHPPAKKRRLTYTETLRQKKDQTDGNKKEKRKPLQKSMIEVQFDKPLTLKKPDATEALYQVQEVITEAAPAVYASLNTSATSENPASNRNSVNDIIITAKKLPERQSLYSNPHERGSMLSEYSSESSIINDPTYDIYLANANRGLQIMKRKWRKEVEDEKRKSGILPEHPSSRSSSEYERPSSSSSSEYGREYSREPRLIAAKKQYVAAAPPPLPPKNPDIMRSERNSGTHSDQFFQEQNQQQHLRKKQTQEKTFHDENTYEVLNDKRTIKIPADKQNLPHEIKAWENEKIELNHIIQAAQEGNIVATEYFNTREAIKTLESILLIMFEQIYKRLPNRTEINSCV